jgi:hypothetical protein
MVERGSDEVTVKRVTGWHVWIHLTDGLAYDVRESIEDLDCRGETVHQLPIVIAIFLEGLFSFMEELEDRLERI